MRLEKLFHICLAAIRQAMMSRLPHPFRRGGIDDREQESEDESFHPIPFPFPFCRVVSVRLSWIGRVRRV